MYGPAVASLCSSSLQPLTSKPGEGAGRAMERASLPYCRCKPSCIVNYPSLAHLHWIGWLALSSPLLVRQPRARACASCMGVGLADAGQLFRTVSPVRHWRWRRPGTLRVQVYVCTYVCRRVWVDGWAWACTYYIRTSIQFDMLLSSAPRPPPSPSARLHT